MTDIAILARHLSFVPMGGEPVLDALDLELPPARHALVGRNGAGKSVLGRILAGTLAPSGGEVERFRPVEHLPQWLPASPAATQADALGLGERLTALRRIEEGSVDAADFELAADDWDAPARCRRWLREAWLPDDPSRRLASLSGGERVRLHLLRLFARPHSYLILDEPGNYLDRRGRAWLLEKLDAHPGGLLLISHDRDLLAAVEAVHELSPPGLRRYGGNYQAYAERKAAETAAAEQDLRQARQALAALERQQQRSRERAEKRRQQAQAGRAQANLPGIGLGYRLEHAQQFQARQRGDHERQLQDSRERLAAARRQQQAQRPQTFDLAAGAAKGGTALLLAGAIPPHGHARPIDLHLQAGERLHLAGDNGSGKSSLLRAILGELPLRAGRLRRAPRAFLIDQHVGLLRAEDTALANLQRLSPGHQETAYRQFLAGIGLTEDRALLPAGLLSGGERMKLALLALDSAREPYGLLLLDEPDSHLDLDSRQLLERALAGYRGALVLVSHDPALVHAAGIERELRLAAALAEPASAEPQCR